MQEKKSKKSNWLARSPRRALFDWHIPEFLPEVKLNVKKYIEKIRKAHVQSITFMAKSAFGCSYYNTKVGHKNSKLTPDLLAEVILLAHEEGIRIIAYYNVTLDDFQSVKHPDWQQRDREGNKIRFEKYDQLCMNSPYRNLVIRQLEEIALNYDIDGLWLDLTYVAARGCYCKYCQERFRRQYGLDIKEEFKSNSSELRNFYEFKRRTRFEFIKEARDSVKKVNPEVLIGWNHAGDIFFGEVEIDEFADFQSREFHPPDFIQGSLGARWMRNFHKPFELMSSECLSSWGDWTLAPESTLKIMAGTALANGGTLIIGHVAYPSGDLAGEVAPAVMDRMKNVFSWIKRREKWCIGAESIPIAACLNSIKNYRLIESMEGKNAYSPEILGISKLLIEGKIHFDIIDEKTLSRIRDYELLILSDCLYLSSEEIEQIKKYVRQGGVLISTYRTSLYTEDGNLKDDFALREIIGTSFEKFSPYTVNYIFEFDKNISSGCPDMPILLKNAPYSGNLPNSRCIYSKPDKGAKALAYFMEPAIETIPGDYKHVYHSHAHPARKTTYPAIIYNEYEMGKSIYFAGSISGSFWNSGSPWLRTIFLNALNIVNPDTALTPIRQCLVKNISVSLIQRMIARTVKKRRLPGFGFGWNFTYSGFGMTFREF